MNIYWCLQNWHYCFYQWCHGVFYVRLTDKLSMRVTNWPNIFVDQGQFTDSDFISGTHQMENGQFANKCNTNQGSFYKSRHLVLLKDLHNQINISTVNILYFHIEPMFLTKIKILLTNYQVYYKWLHVPRPDDSKLVGGPGGSMS